MDSSSNGLVHKDKSYHMKSRDILNIPKHTFLLGYGVEDNLPVIGNLQQRHKFLFVAEDETRLVSAMDNSVRKNRDTGYVIISDRWEFWEEKDFKYSYFYESYQLEYVLDMMEDKVVQSDSQDVVLVIDNVDIENSKSIKRMIGLKMFALFWWADLDVSQVINEEFPDLTYGYKVIHYKNGICAVRSQSKWLNFTLS